MEVSGGSFADIRRQFSEQISLKCLQKSQTNILLEFLKKDSINLQESLENILEILLEEYFEKILKALVLPIEITKGNLAE